MGVYTLNELDKWGHGVPTFDVPPVLGPHDADLGLLPEPRREASVNIEQYEDAFRSRLGELIVEDAVATPGETEATTHESFTDMCLDLTERLSNIGRVLQEGDARNDAELYKVLDKLASVCTSTASAISERMFEDKVVPPPLRFEIDAATQTTEGEDSQTEVDKTLSVL